MYERKEILHKHEDMRQERAREEPTWRELAILLRPDDTEFSSSERRDRRADEDQFDSTPLYALDNFVGGMFGKSLNPSSRWFELGIDDQDLAKYAPVKQWLWNVANIEYASLTPAASSFYPRCPAWLANFGTFGLGVMYQEERVGAEYINDMPIPIGEVFLDRDGAGHFIRLHREYTRKGWLLKKEFGKAAGNKVRDDDTYKVVHCVCENDDFDATKLGPKGMPWSSYYCSPDLDDFHQDGGYYEFPYHIATWAERARSNYPTGPGHNIKSDGWMLQEMERTHLVAGQRQADPLLLAHSEDILSVADVFPGNVLYGAMTEAGKRKVEYLESKGQLQLSMAMSEQRRQAIRTGFYFSMMQVIAGRPQMTATEFLGFSEEDLKLIAPHLVRLQGALATFLARRYRILERAGQIPPVPPELARRRITPKFVDPLARLLKVARGRGVLQAQAGIEQLAATDPAVRDTFHADNAAGYVVDAFTEVPDVLRDPKEVQAIRQARAQAQQQVAQMQAAEQGAGVIADLSHAQQAASLSTERQTQRPN